MKDFEKLVRDAVEQGGGQWDSLAGWYDKHGLPAIAKNAYCMTYYEWILDEYCVTVTVAYTRQEIDACPKCDLSGLPVDWEHVIEYRVITRGEHKEVAHEFIEHPVECIEAARS
jgi:hypothetical protein